MTNDFPENIGRYTIEKKLGQGSMGVVYLGYDSMIDRRVAIKSLRLDTTSEIRDKEKTISLFFDEAKIIGKLNHSHITSIYDIGTQDHCPFLVMEYIKGKTIKDIIRSKTSMSVVNILKLMSMIARGLHYAHQRGVLHRDIKPANIMVMKNLSPKIMDFGIARIMGPSRISNKGDSEKGIILGTPHYMSPEQIRGKAMDQKTDIFSLGVLSYEWISGKKPFRGDNLQEIITDVIKNKPTPLTKAANVAIEIENIISKAMEKDTDKRYASAEEFSDAIELYLTSIIQKDEDDEEQGQTGTFSYNQIRIVNDLRKNYVFFSDFTEEDLFTIFKMSKKEAFKKGDVIIEEGTSGATMYVILKGTTSVMKMINGQQVEVSKLGEGECFGEMSIIDRMPRSATIVAKEDSVLIAISEIVLRTSNPKLCLKLYKNLASMVADKLRSRDTEYFNLIGDIEKSP
jgi:serine/threonine-protein kinase